MAPLSFPLAISMAKNVGYTYICVVEHASQPSVLALQSLATGHYIEQHQEGQGSAELCLALFAE